ncbi:uncharacterized protein LOC128896190 [Hylaeus anthracinus]|uniref:uncharacterized protein LOC128896190 n=1 Tax=Hylaeus anthracinus TaxID=313031 RepID=UPI0023B95051|nr:uncharacterized protein LOC128896190 [Hylaeus anthracinus]
MSEKKEIIHVTPPMEVDSVENHDLYQAELAVLHLTLQRLSREVAAMRASGGAPSVTNMPAAAAAVADRTTTETAPKRARGTQAGRVRRETRDHRGPNVRRGQRVHRGHGASGFGRGGGDRGRGCGGSSTLNFYYSG